MADEKKIKIAVCMPIARAAHPSTMNCLVKLIGAAPFDDFVWVPNFQVDVARNLITQQACSKEEITHLLWIDDDMTFTREDAMTLLAHDLPIVGGLCFGRRHPYPPILIHITPRGFSFDYDAVDRSPGLIECDATGAAFLLVKKEVFFKIHEKFKEGPWTPIGVGEDVSFCRRARDVGYKVFVDTGVKIGHIAEVTIDEKTASKLRQVKVNPYFPPREPAVGDPVASVIVPVFNQQPKRLREAIDSAMMQTVPVEVIVVDDGSDICLWCGAPRNPFRTAFEPCDDPIVKCPGAPQYKHLHVMRLDTNQGCYAAINEGIRVMSTPWFAWLSSDDLYYPNKIERQIGVMDREAHPVSFHGYDLMFGDWGIAQTVIVPPEWTTLDEQKKLLSSGCYINGLTVMIHRSVFDEVGLFDVEHFPITADWEMWNRIGQRHFWHPICETLATRREYDNASQRFAQDPDKRAKWIAEDEEIRRRYGGEPPQMDAEKFLDAMASDDLRRPK